MTSPYIPANLYRQIATHANNGTHRAMRTASKLPKKMYEGLASLFAMEKVKAARSVPASRAPVVNRSRATSNTPKIQYMYNNFVDRYAPQAYKNNSWKYYISPTRNKVIFFTTRNGTPYTFTKEGRRVNVPMSYFERTSMNLNTLRRNAKQRRTTYHTYEAYQKRLNKNIRTVRGTTSRNDAWMNIATKVRRYLEGNTNALNDVTFAQLIWWANRSGTVVPYVKYAGKWRRYGSPNALTRQNIINNIRIAWNLNQN
jgi:hypothetical protein